MVHRGTEGAVQVKVAGKWEDGTAFEAYDSIRVIAPP